MRPLVDLVFPRTCEICGEEPTDGMDFLCWSCLASMWPVSPPLCKCCGNPLAGSVDEEFLCTWCRGQTTYYDKARSAMHYEGILAQLVQSLKYSGYIHLRGDLSMILKAAADMHF